METGLRRFVRLDGNAALIVPKTILDRGGVETNLESPASIEVAGRIGRCFVVGN